MPDRKSESENPVIPSPTPKPTRPTSNLDWWPNQVNLQVLHQHSPRSNPMGNDFDYAQEFKTLKFFLQNPGRVISRDELLNHAWGYDNYPCSRTVDNHVLRLRQKLETDPSRPVHFRTVHRVGYKFVF